MQVKGKIINITVTEEKRNLSLRLQLDGAAAGETLDEIGKLRGVTERYVLAEEGNTRNALYFNGNIHSANLKQKLGVILHAPVAAPLVLKAIELMGKPVYVRFTTEVERELIELLTAAARRESTGWEEILYRLTTYSKNGLVRNGKRSIYDLSVRQRDVVIDKLHRLLSSGMVSPEPRDPCV
jgi:hypothetical protein